MTATEQGHSWLPTAEEPPGPYPEWLQDRLETDFWQTPIRPYDHVLYLRRLLRECREHGYPDRWARWLAENRHDPTIAFIRAYPDDWPEELAHVFAAVDRKHPHPDQTCDEWGCEHSTTKPTGASGKEPGYLRRWTTKELSEEPDELEWLVELLCPMPSFLGIGGEEKTLKSYIGAFLDLCVAAGIPLFGQFKVETSRPVVRHVGEGGMRPDIRRLVRIARSLGLTDAQFQALPLFSYYDVAPESSEPFTETLHRDLEELSPGLVHLDPQYTYADRSVRSSDLVGRGGSLADLYAPVAQRNACLAINDHFNQTGTGFNLKRFTGAGMTEHVDSWCLVRHAKPPTEDDIANGHFALVLKVGSRQWGEYSWNLTIDIGPFDTTINDHIGDITWQISRVTNIRAPLSSPILAVVKEHSGRYTRTGLAEAVGGNRDKTLEEIDRLTRGKHMHTALLAYPEGEQNRPVFRDRYVFGPPQEGT